MRVKLIIALVFSFVLTSNLNSQVFQNWASRYNGIGNYIDEAKAVKVDNYGNAFVTGFSHAGNYAYDNKDIVTIKYDNCGNILWTNRYDGSPGNPYTIDEGHDITIDQNGNSYVTGTSFTAAIFGNSIITIKYGPGGNILWVRNWGNLSSSVEALGKKIRLDDLGNIYVGGIAPGSANDYNYVILKYNTNGGLLWGKTYNGPIGNGDDVLEDLIVDEYGNIFVTGSSEGVGTSLDYCTIKYNSNGVEQWISRYNGEGNGFDEAKSIRISSIGDVIVTGRSMEFEFPQDKESTGQQTFTTIKYNSNGVYQWKRKYFGTGYPKESEGIVLGVDVNNNIYAAGYSMDYNENYNFTLIKYALNGDEVFIRKYNGPGNHSDVPSDLLIDDLNNVYVTGTSRSGSQIETQDYATIKYNSNGLEQWVMRYNGPVNHRDLAAAIGYNGSEIFVTGRSYGSQSTEYDYLTVKYSNSWLQICDHARPNEIRDLNHVKYIGKDTILVIGDKGKIYLSENGGKGWKYLDTLTTKNLNKSYFVNSKTGYIVGDSGLILTTSNGGNNWAERIIDTRINFNDIHFLNLNKLIIVGTEGRILRTINGGYNWISNQVNNKVNLNGIHFINSSTGIIIGDSGNIFRTTDGGVTWINIQVAIDDNLTSLSFFQNSGMIVSENGTMLTTSDGGVNWIKRLTNFIDNVSDVFLINEDLYYLVGANGKILYSRNRGKSWESQNSNINSTLTSVDFLDSNTGVTISIDGKILFNSFGEIFFDDYGSSNNAILTNIITDKHEQIINLSQNFPNPFNPETKISYTILEKSKVELKVYNILGKEIKTLVNTIQESGSHIVSFNGSELASGIYYYKLTVGNFYSVKKMLLIK